MSHTCDAVHQAGRKRKTDRWTTQILSTWLAVLAGCALPSGCGLKQPPSAAETMPIGLEIDFAGQRDNKSIKLVVPRDSTVFDVLSAAQQGGHLVFSSTGRGELAFVTAIDSIENQQSSGDNWVYRVNGKLGERSCGVHALRPADTVQWRFGAYP